MIKKTLSLLLITLGLVHFTGCLAVIGTSSTPEISTDRREHEDILIDQALEIKIKKLVNSIAEFSSSRVQIHCFNGHVLLLGQTESQDNIHLLSQKISEIDGVKKTYNEITVEPVIGLWDWISDRTLSSKIKSSMIVTKGINPLSIQVFTENKVVYLVGIVKEQEEEIAVDIAKNTSGVSKVVKIFERIT